ncbi:MAG TPA: pyridoxamine 5'-phosphate oxidase family protein [Gammaproteobacteria bacterium]|nr:pyridoxamine 5'-phosphate oxidase family protein [Gammaproteobacteria bacterium]
MSTPVESSSLGDAIARYRYAYLMTTNAQGAPHAVAVSAVLQDGALIVDGLGRRTRENALARPAVGLVWPPASPADYSLIVDGQAEVVGDRMRIVPTRAVLHRSAPSPRPKASGACGSDCVELGLPEEASNR